MKIQSYKELIAYKKAFEAVKQVYAVTSKFPKEEMYGLTAQMRRSSISIPSNIAEGYMRGSKEYVQFLKIALGSSAELETQLQLCSHIGFLSAEDYERLYSVTQEVMKLLSSYIRKLSVN
ncbi:MAG: four helix bundle protein [bacterium]